MDKGLNEVRTKNIFFKYFLDKGFFGFEKAVALPGGRRNKREKEMEEPPWGVGGVKNKCIRAFADLQICKSPIRFILPEFRQKGKSNVIYCDGGCADQDAHKPPGRE